VIPIVKTIGLGPGMLLWGSTSLLTGFLTGKFGLFGLHKQEVPHNIMNWLSMVFVVLSMVVFFFIKPTLDKRKEYVPLNDEKASSKGRIQDLEGEKTKGHQEEEEEANFVDKIPIQFRSIIGACLAIGSGVLYGVNMVPMMLWAQHQTDMHLTPGPLDFVFSHFTGIYLYSTVVFIIYCIYNCAIGRPPKVYAEAVLPSMISGAMWGIAQCGLMSATQILGYTVFSPSALLVLSSCHLHGVLSISVKFEEAKISASSLCHLHFCSLELFFWHSAKRVRSFKITCER